MEPVLIAKDIHKTFVLHNQGCTQLPVLENQHLTLHKGECLVLHGHSGSGKSSLLRALYGNYHVNQGEILIRQQAQWLNLVNADSRQIIQLRQHTLGWVSQFLRVIPRLSARDIVMQPQLDIGISPAVAKATAERLLSQLNVPEKLWSLAPATFSGGEQQRVNIAKGFALDYPILLLDEPTASLDKTNCEQVISLIQQAKQRGAAIVGIFHDPWVREQVADRLHPMSALSAPH